MKITHLNSSSIESIVYDKETMRLIVEFARGAIYEYYDVDEFVVKMLIFAESVGKYFHNNIQFKYRYTQIQE